MEACESGMGGGRAGGRRTGRGRGLVELGTLESAVRAIFCVFESHF